MKQNTAKNFFKEHRFIFQEPTTEGGPTTPPIAPTTVQTATPPAVPAGEKPAEAKPGATPGSPEAPANPGATPEATAAAKAVGEEKVEGEGTVKRATALSLVKFREHVKGNQTKFFALTKIPEQSIELRDNITLLNEKDLPTMTKKLIMDLKPLIANKIAGKEADLEEYLKELGGTKEEFIETAAAIQAESFKDAMGNLFASATYQHLQKYAAQPQNKDAILIYTPRFNGNGAIVEIKLGPDDLLTAYNTFHDEQEKLKTSAQKAADAAKAEKDPKERADRLTRMKSYPILKFLSPFLGLDTIDAATNKSGWDTIADGTNTIAMFALDLFGYEDGKGSIEGIASFLPGQTRAKIMAAQKTLSSEKNSLSYAAHQKKNGGQPGAPATPGAPQAPNTPTKLAKGEVPTTNQEKVDMTKFGDIIAKPALMPKTGIVFENAVATGTGGIPKVIQLNMSKGGRLILPGNSDLKIDGEQKVVEPGKTFAYGPNSGKYNNGLITIEGRIDAGTVIDGQVTITNAALEDSK